VLRWLERDGRASTIVPAPAQYLGFSLSPDARQIVFSRAARNGGADVWLRDLTRGSETRLTFDGAAFTPQWSPDGSRVLFSGPAESPPPKLFVRNVATGDAATRIGGVLKMPNFASGWSGDSRSVVSVRIDPLTGNDLWVQRLQDGTAERLPFNTPFNDSHGKVSPDNRLIAYQTDESGRDEVWVASFPSGATRRQVSVGGGSSPEWGENSQELLYLSDDKRLLATHVTAALTTIDVSAPHVLFQIKNLIEVDRIVFPTSNAYVAAANGQRFLVAETARDPGAPPITVLVNWTALLNR
jgi:Tol biopolymer transport system component